MNDASLLVDDVEQAAPPGSTGAWVALQISVTDVRARSAASSALHQRSFVLASRFGPWRSLHRECSAGQRALPWVATSRRWLSSQHVVTGLTTHEDHHPQPLYRPQSRRCHRQQER